MKKLKVFIFLFIVILLPQKGKATEIEIACPYWADFIWDEIDKKNSVWAVVAKVPKFPLIWQTQSSIKSRSNPHVTTVVPPIPSNTDGPQLACYYNVVTSYDNSSQRIKLVVNINSKNCKIVGNKAKCTL